MTEQVADLTIRKTITVETDQAHAFKVFTEQIGSWWPLDTKAIGTTEAETAILEPQAGGRWFERGVDGSECDWGRVIAYEPPNRVVLNWQISADWRYDPSIKTEVEVRFIAQGENETLVELEHRGLREAYGDAAEQVYGIFTSADGWGSLLDCYAQG